MNLAETYIKEVTSGKRPVGKLARLAVERHLQLFNNSAVVFDAEAANRVLRFFSHLRHTSGTYGGKPFALLPWQAFLLWVIFGWKKKDGYRLFTKVYVEVARKNGKSEFAGALGLYLAFYDNHFGAEVYSAANTGDQAAICWSAGAKMAKMLAKESKAFAEMVKIYDSTNNRILSNPATGSLFKPVASEAHNLDGLRPHGAIIDEWHEARHDNVLRVMESGMVDQTQPLLMVITTAGFNVNGPCYNYRKTIVDILEGRKSEPGTFGLIYTLDEGDDWNDEETWYKANPSTPQTPTLEGLRREYSKAKTEGSGAEINFRTKNLNQWLTTKTRWISDEVWMKNKEAPILDKSLRWWAGLDLSTTRDLTALAMISEKDSEGKHNILLYFFHPEENARMRSRRDGVPYLDWHAAGLIEFTPGDVVDQDYIFDRIMQITGQLDVQLTLYDPYNATQMAINLATNGRKNQAIAQTTKNFHEAVKYIETSAALGILRHGGNDLMRWMIQNVEIYRDTNGNGKINKRGAEINRVDGPVALEMAVAGYLNHVASESIYNQENRGLLTL